MYSEDTKATIRRLADAGMSWDEIGREIGRSAKSVKSAARRMRAGNEWPDNPDSVRVPPNGPGRPRNRTRYTAVSVRVSPDVANALRAVARSAGYGRRVGLLLTEAAKRAVGDRIEPPCGLDPGKPKTLIGGNRSVTLSACVDTNAFDALKAAHDGVQPMSALHGAVVLLLQDLNYRIES